jgi:hypothetical protein
MRFCNAPRSPKDARMVFFVVAQPCTGHQLLSECVCSVNVRVYVCTACQVFIIVAHLGSVVIFSPALTAETAGHR